MSTGARWSRSFGSAAVVSLQVYDEVMVPRIFEPFARLLLDQVEVTPGQALLDVACGPGTVARLAAERLGPAGRVTACDLSPAMLSLAQAKPSMASAAAITYLEGPADSLPVPDNEFDVVTCQQGFQFFPERDAAVAEMHRALRSGGRVGLAVWTDIGSSPAMAALADAIGDVAGQELGDAYRGGPWGFPDGDRIGRLLERGGFSDIRVSRHVLRTSYEGGAAQLASTLSASGIAEQIEQLPPEQKDQLVDALTRRLGSGAIDSEMESNIVTARR